MPRSEQGGQPGTTGRIHSIESFGTVDGPGIRVVVFFQGCHLRCQFCHNPDTWLRSGGHEVSIQNLVAQVLKYRAWFERSGGGVTASGGDPILQAPFVGLFFEALRSQGVHTALDTSGLYRIGPAVERMLDATDLVLLDVKHPDEMRHRKLTGAGVALSRAFGAHLVERAQPTWVRHVIVPGWTDDEETVSQLIELDASLGDIVKRVELLPYHDYGRSKWEQLGREYPLADTPPPSAQQMSAIRDRFVEAGLPAVTP